MNSINSISIEAAKKYINEIDFSMIINKMVKQLGWRKKDALKTCELYKHFLFLLKKYGEQYKESIPPSEHIDEFWHNHILDTNKYITDCDAIFGKYLHHYPYFGFDGKSTIQDLNQAFEVTQQLHYREFGDYIYRSKCISLGELIKIPLTILIKPINIASILFKSIRSNKHEKINQHFEVIKES